MTTTIVVNGNTYTDDDNPTTGMGNGGHRARLLPMISDTMVEVSSVEANVTAAQNAAISSQTYRDTTLDYKNTTLGYRNEAETFKNQSQGYRNEAETFKNQAQASVGSVYVSATDTTLGKLSSKLIQGSNIVLTVNNSGANETISISSTGVDVKILSRLFLM